MSRRKARATQADITRAVRGAIKGGLLVTGVQIDGDGKIVVLSGGQSQPDGVETPDDFEGRLRRGTGWAK